MKYKYYQYVHSYLNPTTIYRLKNNTLEFFADKWYVSGKCETVSMEGLRPIKRDNARKLFSKAF